MILFVMLSVIAAVMFHRKTAEKGYRSPRFWMYPLIVGNGLLLFAIVAKWLASTVLTDAASPMTQLYGPVVDVLALLVFFLIIAKAWKQIQQLPPCE
jgi:hypothetical protein